MIRYVDEEELETIGAEPWQIELLHLNPDYCSWGNGEDHMGEGRGWGGSLSFDTWEKGRFTLDDLNEIVNFYFYIHREQDTCPHCEGSGLTPGATRIDQTFHAWEDHLHDDEILALVKAQRINIPNWAFDRDREQWVTLGMEGWEATDQTPPLPSPGEVKKMLTLGIHDAINRNICSEVRARRMGFGYRCESCNGEGAHYTEELATVGLQLWVLHPRKGAARGWRVERIVRDELPEVFAVLKSAAERNAARFSKIP